MRKLALLLATCCGIGFVPLAPGTVGAASGLLPVFLLREWPFAYAAVACLLFFLGVRASTVAEVRYGERDSSRIVIDEAVSMMFTLFCIPLTAFTVVVGFVLNRFFDVVKPFPARKMESLAGGWGVMMDDLVAGIYGNLTLRVIWHLWLRYR